MKKIVIIFVGTLLCYACIDQRANTSKFIFENEKTSAIKDSLDIFKTLSLKIFNSGLMEQEDTLEIPALGYNYSLELSVDNTIYFDKKNLGTWKDFESNKDKIFQLRPLSVLTHNEKNKLFNLLKYLNQNYINGIVYYYTKDKYSVFHYHEKPFHGIHDDRFNKIILLESDFYLLDESKRRRMLNVNLITDKQDGMLLLMTQKEKYLAWVYGSYDKIPEKWKQPTDEIFYKD